MTYSIVARDAGSGAFGVAVQSHWFSVGGVVPAAEEGVGAVATQAFAERSYGPLGLTRMREGAAAGEALAALLAADPLRERRQVAMLDARGRAAVHTGSGCVAAAGHATGDGVCAQGNMLERPGVPEAMVAAYERTPAPFAERLLAALDAAEELGGDARGRQSAAIVVTGGVDLRVEDHPDPLAELRRLYRVALAYGQLDEAIDAGDVERLAAVQAALGEANLEPTFWRAAALAGRGRHAEARVELERAAASNPRFRELFGRLVPAGLLTHEHVERTLRD